MAVAVELDDASRSPLRAGDVVRGRLVVTNGRADALEVGDGTCTIDVGLFFDGERASSLLRDCRGGAPAGTLVVRAGERREIAFELPVVGPGGAYDVFGGPLVEDERTRVTGPLWSDAVQVIVSG